MNTIVREMNPVREIELTDAQLGAVYGAWGEECEPQPECGCPEEELRKRFEKEVKIHVAFEFDFDAEFKQEKSFR